MLSEENYLFEVDWEKSSDSAFDIEYDRIWRQKMKDGLFRCELNIDRARTIVGERTSYFVQLNVNRAVNKRDPLLIEDIRQPFDESKFNFTQIREEEVMFHSDGDQQNLIVINDSPLEHGHSLLLPSVFEKLPQVLITRGLEFAISVILSSSKPTFRVGFNGLLANATMNHLHFHAYHLDRMMPLETIKVNHLTGRCYILDGYPSRGFAFQIRTADDIKPVVDDVVRVSRIFLDHQLPHNLYITRGLRFDNDVTTTKRDSLRVFLWARAPSPELELKGLTAASRLLFGHFLVTDPQTFDSIDENFLETTLTTLTEDSMNKALPLVRSLFEE